MSLRSTLYESIAALDRIAPDSQRNSYHHARSAPGSRRSSFAYYDEKLARGGESAYVDTSGYNYAAHDDEKFIRLSTSTAASLPYCQQGCWQRRFQDSRFLPEVDSEEMERREDDHEPKLTLRYVGAVTLELINIFFSVAIPSVGICIIGLAADNIAWSTAPNSLATVVLTDYDAQGNYYHWWTKMHYLPGHYDTTTFAGLIVAGAIAAIGGTLAGVLGVVRWGFSGRIELGPKKVPTRRTLGLARLAVEAFMFLTSLVILICVRSLYYRDSYDPYDRMTWSPYHISPKNVYPPLPPPSNDTYTWELVDDIPRTYISRVNYNPLNWNCRVHGRVDSMGSRFWQLCQEGNAARWLLVSLLLLQAIVLAKHVWDFRVEHREGKMSWMRQREGSRERIVGAEERE